MRQLYKVHSYGAVYLIISYNGKIPIDERRSDNLINEVYSTVPMADSMLETVAEMREKSQNF